MLAFLSPQNLLDKNLSYESKERNNCKNYVHVTDFCSL